MALNFSVFHYEVMKNHKDACELADRVLQEALDKIDELEEDDFHDAKRIIELTNSSSKIVFEPPLMFMTQLGLPDLTRAKEQLAWLPLVSLDQGLKRSIEYTIAHRGLIRSTFGK